LVSSFEIDLAGWLALADGAARRFAERVALAVDAELVGLKGHDYRGRQTRLALFRRGDTVFSLVPGGEVRIGYNAGRFEPTPGLVADYAAYLAQCPDPLAEPDLVALVASRTTAARTVTVPTLLVAVGSQEAGVAECAPDHPRIVGLVANVPDVPSIRGSSGMEWHLWARVRWSPERVVERAWLIDVPSYAETLADLAGRGERLATPDEWDYACGAGAQTLWRWGDECPLDAIPVPDEDGPHREPNLFGLAIADDPYHAERTAVRQVRCGGDGGVWLHHGDFGQVGAWLPLASAYRDSARDEVTADRDGKEMAWIRPVIAL
jgi:hypothetical protein